MRTKDVPHLTTQAIRLAVGCILLLAARSGWSQEAAPAPSTAATSSSPSPTTPPEPKPTAKVVRVERKIDNREDKTTAEKRISDQREDKKTVKLGDTILVEVMNLDQLRKEAVAAKKDIILFLDERPVVKATAFPPTDPNKNELQFPLKRSEESRELWTHLLGSPPTSLKKPVAVSVGLEDGYAIPSAEKMMLRIIPGGWLVVWGLLVLGLLALFIWLAGWTDLLRDFGSQPDDSARKPFSLARTQAAWWFFLILTSYLFIGMITGDFNTTITESVLILMGISAATAIGSAIVDTTKTTSATESTQLTAAAEKKTRLTELTSEMAPLRAAIARLPQATDAEKAVIAERQRELDAKVAELARLESEYKKLSNQSENIFLDMLSDVHGISFHRFQIFAWTLILGIIFVIDVYEELAMPKFGNNLLTLMGISAGTYVGLKIPEKNVPAGAHG